MPRAANSRPSLAETCRRITALLAAAVPFVARDRGEAMIRKWLSRCDITAMSDERMVAMTADAMLLSTDLLLSYPAASGTTAFERLARSRAGERAAEATLIGALCHSRFRLLRLEQSRPEILVRDVLTDELLHVIGVDMPPLAAGIALFGRVVMLGDDCCSLPGAITPLDAAAFALARSHIAAGAPGPAAGARWAEAVYGYVVQHGTMDVPGLNRPAADPGPEDDVLETEEGELFVLATAWAALAGRAPDAGLLQRTRQCSGLPTILEALAAAVSVNDARAEGMSIAFERLLLVQLQTVLHRERNGAGTLSLAAVENAVNDAIATGWLPPVARALFVRLRRLLVGGRSQQRSDNPALERVVQRIQGLRAKTVAQGCTEEEALAAAEKAAELLDRYGLSLGELEFRAQPCNGAGIETGRHRFAPIDNCVPAIAGFFDCRVWAERAEGRALRYVFFGLRGDVAAAQYLYDMVERAFDTETEAFRAGTLYAQMAGARRSATHSFQIGLARGICTKLTQMQAARDASRRSASGRDLVPLKAAMVEEELARLGLDLHKRALGRGTRVLADAYTAGEAAGQQFDFRPAITEAA